VLDADIRALRSELLRLEGRVLALEGWRAGQGRIVSPEGSQRAQEALQRLFEKREAEAVGELERRAASGVPDGGMAVTEGDRAAWEREWMLDR